MRKLLVLAIAVSAGVAACSVPDVVVYCALDQVHSEPILEAFERETGLKVQGVFDVEAVKTVGLVNRIVEEKDNPKGDVFWNNELVHTVRLKSTGLLAPYVSPSAADIPDGFKDPEGYWTGFAARARVFILNEEVARTIEPDESKWPKSTMDLLDPKWKGNVGMAKPLAGTTLTHMSVLWAEKGSTWVESFWKRLLDNEMRMPTGNAHLMKEVSEGNFAFGYTDTDDFRKAELAGKPVRRIFPDQDGGEIGGCLVIPNSIALIEGGPNPENGKKLIDYVLSGKVEEKLAASASAQMPVRKSVPRPEYVKSAEELVTLKVDWEMVARAVEPASAWLGAFLNR
ncbi:MAG: extracellular solute-binding protein [Planctomycetota bacterium]|jgi:iron(III) transport system substrate-binding protein